MTVTAPRYSDSPVVMVGITTEALQELIIQGHLFAFLDACDEPAIQSWIQEDRMKLVSLYGGAAVERLACIAPYLAKVDLPLFNWIEDQLSDRPWGYFIVATSQSELAELRRHFRRFLMVAGPDGRELYFRFYDPRVIATFLEASSESEATEFFGSVQEFVIPNKKSYQAIRLQSMKA